MRHENIINVDIEKEKYQSMLHQFTDLEKDHSDLKMAFEGRDQECQTLQSHNQIQNS